MKFFSTFVISFIIYVLLVSLIVSGFGWVIDKDSQWVGLRLVGVVVGIFASFVRQVGV